MQLLKKNIHTNKLKCKSNLQLILDDDFNVPDIKPDIDVIIKEQGSIIIEDIRPMNGRLSVKGVVQFNVLYLSDEVENPVHNIPGKISFDEIVNMNEGCVDDDPIIKCKLDDLATTLINSRKIRINAIINLDLSIEESIDQETAIGTEVGYEKDVQAIHKQMEITALSINNRDTYRIKDEIQIPSTKDNISELLYSEINVNAVEMRLLEDKFSIKGEMPVFIIYKSNNEENPINFYETVISFSGMIECPGCNDTMIEDILWTIISKEINIREDLDGEDRIVDVEVMLALNIKAYEIEEVEVLDDIYSPSKELKPVYGDINYENIIVKNNSKHRISDRIKVEEKQPNIIQICNATSEVKIDDIRIGENELEVEGVIDISILYISEEDARPINALQRQIPFNQNVEVKGIKNNSIYDVKPSIDQLSVIMMDRDEIEVKSIINLNTIVFDSIVEQVITDIEVEELDLKKLQSSPGLVGYIVKNGDSLWNIAKEYYTTIDSIKELNELESDNINEGDKILIMKQISSIV